MIETPDVVMIIHKCELFLLLLAASKDEAKHFHLICNAGCPTPTKIENVFQIWMWVIYLDAVEAS